MGLGAFLVLAAFPAWPGLGTASTAQPELEPATDSSGCVEEASDMVARHQGLLNEWRHSFVREGARSYTSDSGREWEIGLTGTCLGCHDSAEGFCRRCHDYADVAPTCWSCHVDEGS
jgi:hypothetical protein